MKKIKLAGYILQIPVHMLGAILGIISWRISGDGLGLVVWCAGWQLFVCHKIFQILDEEKK